MSIALQRYKVLVDELRALPINSAESTITVIDEQLKETWASLCEADKVEAEAYWRASTSQLPTTESTHDLN